MVRRSLYRRRQQGLCFWRATRAPQTSLTRLIQAGTWDGKNGTTGTSSGYAAHDATGILSPFKFNRYVSRRDCCAVPREFSRSIQAGGGS